MYVIPATVFNGALSQYSTRPLINIRFEQLDKHWYEFIPDTHKEQGEEFKYEVL